MKPQEPPVLARLRRRPLCLASTALGAMALVLSIACTSTDSQMTQAMPMAFTDYQRATHEQLRERRHFQTNDVQTELALNGPREWRPAALTAGKVAKGILLVHGLGDSPWSFNDVAPRLAAQGFLVRAVLLPGHGTRPKDLLDATIEQWRQVVEVQTAALARDVEHVYLGGFSTGANLALEHAYAHPDIAGLVLFSPGFRSNSPLAWLAPLVARFRPWLVASDGHVPMQNSVRYLNTPTNGFAQFYRSSRTAQRLLRERTYDKPVFMVVARHDSVLDTDYLLDVFQRRFTHPASRLVWYGQPTEKLTDATRVLVRADRLPRLRISQFSHMGLLFSPVNPLYGMQGSLRVCRNGQDEPATESCEQGGPVWYSDWGYREDGKVHARLTFNPYFDWQASVMADVLAGRSPHAAESEETAADLHPSSSEPRP